MSLGLTWHDVVHMYKCHLLADSGYYLKSRSPIVRLISCLPKSNKGMKDDFLIVLGAWHDDLHCPVWEGDQVGYLRFRSPPFFFFFWSKGSSPLALYSSILFVFRSFPMVISLYWPGLSPWMFLHIKGTLLPGSASSTLRVSTRCWDPRSLWVKIDNDEPSIWSCTLCPFWTYFKK